MDVDHAFEQLIDKLNIWFSALIGMLPNLLLASLILVLGFYLSKGIRNQANKRIRRFFPTITLADLSINLIYVFCLGVVIFSALKILNLDSTIMTALGAAGILGVGLAFAFQDIAANFISGVFLAFSKPFKVGELITTNDLEGFVVEVKLRDTTIRTHQGHLISIPNRLLMQNPLINYTRYGKRRADITGGISYADDLEKVRNVAEEALKNVPNVISKDTTFFFEELGDSSVNFRIRIWVDSDQFGTYLQFINDVIITLTTAFRENDITIPFPIRTLDFDMKGGEKLSDVELHVVDDK